VLVTEDSLVRCVHEVRVALADNDQQIIKTVSKRGYLFTPAVSPIRDSESAGPAEIIQLTGHGQGSSGPPTAVSTPRRGLARLHITARTAIITGTGILITAVLGGMFLLGEGAAGSSATRPSIAVLPFVNLSGDPQQEFFSDGLSDDLITSLSKFASLLVIARNSAFAHKDQYVDPRQIGRKLNARYLLRGSIRRDGERIRVNVQLVDATTDGQVWAESYDRDLTGVFAVQDDITRKIAVTLVSHVTNAELSRALRKPPESWAAYEYYLRGSALLKMRGGSERGKMVWQARDFLTKAVAVDGHYAPAMQALAETYGVIWLEVTDYEPLRLEHRQDATIKTAVALAQKAVEIDPYLAESHATLAWVLHWAYRRQEAMAEFARAMALNPNLTDGRYTHMLFQNGRPEEAIQFMNGSMRLDPFPPPIYLAWLGNAYYLTGDYPQAFDLLKAASARMPGYTSARVWLAATAAQLGHDHEARTAAGDVRALEPSFTIPKWLDLIRLARTEDSNRLAEGLRKAGLPE
jgi:adenylate cyclase